MKRIFLICMILLLLGLCACEKDSDDKKDRKNNRDIDPYILTTKTNDEYEYDVYEDHIEIVEYLGDAKEVEIPREIDNKPVTRILGFQGENVKKVIIPEGVTHIGVESIGEWGKNVFDGEIEEIDIPQTVIFASPRAFCGTTWYANLDEKHTIVGNGILIKCNNDGEENIVYPKGIKQLSACGWVDLGIDSNTRSIEIPEGTTGIYVQFGTVWGESVENIQIPSTLKKMPHVSFSFTKWYATLDEEFVIVGDGILIKTNFDDLVIDELVIPDNVKCIEAKFEREDGTYPKVNKIIVPECPNGISSTLTYLIEQNREIYGNNIEIEYDGKSLYEHNASCWYCNLDSVEITPNTKKIGNSTFEANEFTSVDIPDGVEIIGDRAFASCVLMKEVILPDSIKVISDEAFSYCSELENIVIPDGVRYIGDSAFWMCNKIKSITIPSSVKYIGDKALETQYEVIYNYDKEFEMEVGETVYYNVDIIYGESGSYAEKYAKDNNIKFIDVNSDESDYDDEKGDEGNEDVKVESYFDDKIRIENENCSLLGLKNGMTFHSAMNLLLENAGITEDFTEYDKRVYYPVQYNSTDMEHGRYDNVQIASGMGKYYFMNYPVVIYLRYDRPVGGDVNISEEVRLRAVLEEVRLRVDYSNVNEEQIVESNNMKSYFEAVFGKCKDYSFEKLGYRSYVWEIGEDELRLFYRKSEYNGTYHWCLDFISLEHKEE